MEAMQSKGDAALGVKFYMNAVQDPDATKQAGRPVFVDVEYIKIVVPGDKYSIVDRAVRDGDRSRFAIQYQRFSSGKNQEQEVGTPLKEWPVLTKAQAETLVASQVRTVEQLAAMSDANVSGLGPGYRQLQRQAKAFLEVSAGNAPVQKMVAELEERDLKIASQEAQLKELQKVVAELTKSAAKKDR